MTFAGKYDKSIVSGYASGFGASCLTSSGSYLLLTFYFSIQTTMLIMIIIPVIILLDYCIILTDPAKDEDTNEEVSTEFRGGTEDVPEECNSRTEGTSDTSHTVTYREKFAQLSPLVFTSMLPNCMTSLLMCFMSLGLFELVYVDTTPLSRDTQYRMYTALWHLGILIGMSSAQLFPVKRVWIFMLIEGLLVGFFLTEVLQSFHTIIPVAIAAVLEGLISGCAYANTFYIISGQNKCEEFKDFNMEVALLLNEVGSAVAGFLAIPSHNYLCSKITV